MASVSAPEQIPGVPNFPGPRPSSPRSAALPGISIAFSSPSARGRGDRRQPAAGSRPRSPRRSRHLDRRELQWTLLSPRMHKLQFTPMAHALQHAERATSPRSFFEVLGPLRRPQSGCADDQRKKAQRRGRSGSPEWAIRPAAAAGAPAPGGVMLRPSTAAVAMRHAAPSTKPLTASGRPRAATWAAGNEGNGYGGASGGVPGFTGGGSCGGPAAHAEPEGYAAAAAPPLTALTPASLGPPKRPQSVCVGSPRVPGPASGASSLSSPYLDGVVPSGSARELVTMTFRGGGDSSGPPSRASGGSPGGSWKLARSPRVTDQHFTPAEMVAALGKVAWFRNLSQAQLTKLAERGRLKVCTRYATIIREGVLGSYFYVLLHGEVRCTSTAKVGLSVTLQAPSSFGEGALITKVKRTATVTALEPCHMLLFTAEDIEGFELELTEVRSHVVSLILETVTFFRDLKKPQLEGISKVLDLQYYVAGDRIFEEGALGDRMYVLLEGSVVMQKRHTDGQSDVKIAEFNPQSERPWFGEIALLGGKSRRTCAAVCAEHCKMLVLRSNGFAAFLELVPTFHGMFLAQAQAYAALDAMRRAGEKEGDILNVASLVGRKAWVGQGKPGGGVVGSPELIRACEHWKQLVMRLLADTRRQAQANRMKNTLLVGFTRVSYVAAPQRALRDAAAKVAAAQALARKRAERVAQGLPEEEEAAAEEEADNDNDGGEE